MTTVEIRAPVVGRCLGRLRSRVLSLIRFDGPTEAEFRVDFDRMGRSSRSELWLVGLGLTAAVLVFNRTLLTLPSGVLPLGHYFAVAVLVPMILRWLSGDRSPVRTWSSLLFIASVYLDVGWMMTLRAAWLKAGIDTVPMLLPVAALMSLIVVQIRFVLLAPAILLGLAGLIGIELWAVDTDSNGLFDMTGAAALVAVSLTAAYEHERWTRIGWLRQRDLDVLAGTDPLTGLANRRRFSAVVRSAAEAAAQHHGSVALMVLDVDHFKAFNDRYGHPAGDRCLAAVGEYLGTSAGTGEFVARLGGEEFAVLWTDGAAAAARGEQLRRGLSNVAFEPLPGATPTITASAGIAVLSPGDSAVDHVVSELFAQADTALYEAKRGGRDTLTVFAGQRLRGERQRTGAAVGRGSSVDRDVTPARSAQWADGREAEFAAASEAEGRSARRLIMLSLLAVIAVLLIIQGPLLKIPPEADRLGRLTLIFGLAPGALLALLGNTWPRLHRWAPQLYIAGVAVILIGQMTERVLQLPRGYDVVPLVMPLSVVLSLTVVQIPFVMVAPAALTGLGAIVAVELAAFPVTGNRLISVGTCIVTVAVTLRFAYKLERSRRIGWLTERRLDELSRLDSLTGLVNRRQFGESVCDLLRLSSQQKLPVAFMILDIDNFKVYNDSLGHLAGDDCLRAVSDYLAAEMIPVEGVAARLGGEEFALVWIDTDGDGFERGERIRCGVSGLGIPAAPGDLAVTVSAGIVVASPDGDPGELAHALQQQADAALYIAKRSGKDRASVMEP